MNPKKDNPTHLEQELYNLKKELIKMMHLVESQLERARKAFSERNLLLADEVHLIEKKVDAADINLDEECENIIALYNPVASDLRFVLASLKIIAHLERVGDHADKIVRYIRKKQVKKPFPPELLEAVKFDKMFDLALETLEIATEAFVEENSKKARDVFLKDVQLNKIYNSAIKKMSNFANEKDAKTDGLLYLFSVINKLERVGDMAKNIAEETIFYIEAKVIRHRKVKKLEDL